MQIFMLLSQSALLSCLSTTLFDLLVNYYLTDNVRTSTPWNMMFADDLVLCAENVKDGEVHLKNCRRSMEDYRMKINRTKTEYISIRAQGDRVELAGVEIKKVIAFKY